MKFKNRMVLTQGLGFLVLPIIAGASNTTASSNGRHAACVACHFVNSLLGRTFTLDPSHEPFPPLHSRRGQVLRGQRGGDGEAAGALVG